MLVLFVLGMVPCVVFAQEEIIEDAIVDLSEMLNVSPDEIVVDHVADVMWPDPFLGCDLPENADMAAAMVIVSGWRITLNVDGEAYYYHSDKDDHWLYCPAEYSTPGHSNVATPLQTVPLSVNLSDISTLSNTPTIQVVLLVMVLVTLCTISRVHCGHERR